jgi:hypothetical protein
MPTNPARYRFAVAALSLLALASGTRNAAAREPELLPEELGGWKRTEWQRVESPRLERVNQGDVAALLREYGAQGAEEATYRRGADEGRVTVYEMADRSGAYGAFTLLGAPTGLRTYHRVALGEAGAAGVDAGLFYQGNFLVNWRKGGPLDELEEHLKRLAGAQASLPTLPSYLPAEGLVAGSERYLLGPRALAEVAPYAAGDWVGFAYGAEAVLARYRLVMTRDDARWQSRRAEATLILFHYPTPQIAEERLRSFAQLFDLNGSGVAGRREVFSRRTGTLLVFVTGTDADSATALLERVRYERQLAWSDPIGKLTTESYVMLIIDIFVNTGLLLVLVLVLGVVVGVLRLSLARLLAVRDPSRGPEPEVILLDLQHEPKQVDF